MRIRTDGDRAHRKDTIESAATFWGCNKTTALLKSADFSRRVGPAIEEVLRRDDLTPQQKREIAETLSVPGTLEIEIEETASIQVE
jgi:hypothetical protein